MPSCLITTLRVYRRRPTIKVDYSRQKTTEPMTVALLSSKAFGGSAAGKAMPDSRCGVRPCEAYLEGEDHSSCGCKDC